MAFLQPKHIDLPVLTIGPNQQGWDNSVVSC